MKFLPWLYLNCKFNQLKQEDYMENKLYAVYLGGRSAKCNIELHDVVFVVGKTIEDTYEQLLSKWFGNPIGLHIDSWIELSIVDGFKVSLSKEKQGSPKRLYFVNLGAYLPGVFGELHANSLVVEESERLVKKRAMASLMNGMENLHIDDIYDIDDCLEIYEVDNYYVHLTPTTETSKHLSNNGYYIIPKNIVDLYMQRHVLTLSCEKI